MAYDAAPDTPINSGNQIHLSADFNDKEEAEDVFNNLSGSGIVHHEFREREWGFFGRCTDKYGINLRSDRMRHENNQVKRNDFRTVLYYS